MVGLLGHGWLPPQTVFSGAWSSMRRSEGGPDENHQAMPAETGGGWCLVMWELTRQETC